jgi:hypothetical protein
VKAICISDHAERRIINVSQKLQSYNMPLTNNFLCNYLTVVEREVSREKIELIPVFVGWLGDLDPVPFVLNGKRKAADS